MKKLSPVDISESQIQRKYSRAFSWLLRDMSTGKNLIWATKDYEAFSKTELFDAYSEKAEMRPEFVVGTHEKDRIIRPRCAKPRAVQKARSRDKAEVFTPAWICNVQNNLIDAAWFGRKQVFNKEQNGGRNWKILTPKLCKSAFDAQGRITFPHGKTWQDYVKLRRMEAACGEAPYLVSRYDATKRQVEPIPLARRIGILDRKLRVVSENTHTESDWILWAKQAFQSVYGYEFQGDNVLLARENLLYTFVDYFFSKFGFEPADSVVCEIAEIIAWNIWQMDALKLVVPFSCCDEVRTADQPELLTPKDVFPKKSPCPGCAKNDRNLHNGVYCKIKDWERGEVLEFRHLLHS